MANVSGQLICRRVRVVPGRIGPMEQSWPETAGQFNANAASRHAPIRERTRGGWKASTAGSGSFVYGFLAAYDRALRKAGDIFARRMSSVSNRQPHDNPVSCKVQPPPTTPPGRQATLTP